MAADPTVSANSDIQSQPSPSKRPRLLPDSDTSPMSPFSKGKAPMVEPSASPELECDDGEDGSSEPQQCGICLSEEGHAVRGRINSCDHYFCFLCIIEWSKIESRCPLCKRRFSSIRRMRSDGSFIGDRAVVVPVRDQVYDPYGNATTGPLDPYANVRCNVCAGSTDENLLLLCDLCDTAVHTYCAGLGATVPEGDWFCQECAQMKAEELNGKPVTKLVDPRTSDQCNTETASVQAPMSIYDIVREPKQADPEVDRLLKLFSTHENQSLSSPNALPCRAHQNANVAYERSRISMRSGVEVKESSVRTLPRCRDVQKHIHALRENWTALRSGSLRFPSGRFDSSVRNNSIVNDATRGYGSNGRQSYTSENSVQPAREHGSLGGDTTNKYDVDRAWKMLDIAKSMAQPQNLSGTSSLPSENLSLKVSASKGSNNLFLASSSKILPSRTKSNTLTESKMHQLFKKPDECESKRSEQHKDGIRMGRGKTTVTGLAAASCGNSIVSSNRNTQKSIQTNVFLGQAIMLPEEKLGQGDFSTCKTSLAEPLMGASGFPSSKLQIKPAPLSREVRSGRNIDGQNPSESKDSGRVPKSAGKRASTENICSGTKRIKFDDAKSEIQSLVKLNLKLLTVKTNLEVDKFKDIARCSTHEILAACGLETRRDNKLPIPESICSHCDQLHQRRKSLMPGSCSECFYVFVKDVVSLMLSQKTSC